MQLSRRTVLTSMVAAATVPRWSLAGQERRILVAHYSYMGHTKSVAEKVSAVVGGELFEIQMAEPYPLDLERMATRARSELETGKLPPLLGKLPDMSNYDLVLVGGPVWWNTIAPPVMRFLEETDFKGRNVAAFAAYALAPAHYERNFAAQARNASVLPGLMVSEFDISERQADGAISSWALQVMSGRGPQAL